MNECCLAFGRDHISTFDIKSRTPTNANERHKRRCCVLADIDLTVGCISIPQSSGFIHIHGVFNLPTLGRDHSSDAARRVMSKDARAFILYPSPSSVFTSSFSRTSLCRGGAQPPHHRFSTVRLHDNVRPEEQTAGLLFRGEPSEDILGCPGPQF